ncbi:unnamed protein product [Ilex paraguariensis]|uniref:Uncharacterized protein n=1 Tax=Ilex paraguariensis TaxID=185542 RepID=A0ABC8TCL5_9AQUA
MANDTRSTRKSKEDESSSSGKRFVSGKGCSTSAFGATNTPGLRRSSRETSSRKQITSSPSSTRKSERLEKRTPTTPPVKKKFERIQKHKMPSPLKRSDRGKKNISSSSSGSKKSDIRSVSSGIKQKEKRETNVKKLTMEARKVNKSEKHDLKPVDRKRKRMDARTYKSLFKLQKRDITADVDEELERPDKLSQVDGGDDRSSGSKQVDDGDDECSGKLEEKLREECVDIASEGSHAENNGNHVEVELPYSSRTHSCTEELYKPSDEEGIKASKSGAMVTETLVAVKRVVVNDGDVDLGSGSLAIPSKTKKYTTDEDFNPSATVACKDICISASEAVSSPSSVSKKIVELCVACSTRRRY